MLLYIYRPNEDLATLFTYIHTDPAPHGFIRGRMVGASTWTFASFPAVGHFIILLMLQNSTEFRTVMSRCFGVPSFAIGGNWAPENSCNILKRSLVVLFRCCTVISFSICVLLPVLKTSPWLHWVRAKILATKLNVDWKSIKLTHLIWRSLQMSVCLFA